MALQKGLKGWVNNTTDGVHILVQDTQKNAEVFLQAILDNLPPLAVVTHYNLEKIETEETFENFDIVASTEQTKTNLLLTPDVALCTDCREELHNPKNRRYQYPFITCTNCGPRYSIINKLPYDRPFTTMQKFEMCPTCHEEYNDPMERRHYSQTNSCPDCAIEMQLYEVSSRACLSGRQAQSRDFITNFTDLSILLDYWQQGKIIAIKGIGGYLLTCDATNPQAIGRLRNRKHRPTKPFALMYPSLEVLKKDAHVSEQEQKELLSITAPIVLLQPKDKLYSELALDEINKGLSKIGVMLAYTPLMDLLLNDLGKPIVATSGNMSNSTIIYQDETAIKELCPFADLILMNNRDILMPQDDGVVQFSAVFQKKITLRRSRGKAPVYINSAIKIPEYAYFAPGSMLKSVFGFTHEQNFYVSQYLGNTESYDAQKNYENTFKHLLGIFKTEFDKVIVDKHPDYFATRFGRELATKHKAEVLQIQHHKAHFWSVLGEHNLMETNEPVLGVIWDGTGLGDDGHIWGAEFFKYENSEMERVAHLEEFPFMLGDKMVLEPRISAFVLFHNKPEAEKYLKPKFTDTEWTVYQKMLKNTKLKSTSMGRLFDAVSSLLFGFDKHTFEAEASMQLENQAVKFQSLFSQGTNSNLYFRREQMSPRAESRGLLGSHSYLKKEIPSSFLKFLLNNILKDLNDEKPKDEIAYKFHITLVDYIALTAQKFNIKSLAFSGGVFQNALLVDLIIDKLQADYKLYFQEEFSPNDEGIPFGQLIAGIYT